MPDPLLSEFTMLLEASRQGDGAAMNRIMPLVYDELHRIAHRYLSAERQGHTLQTTALVHEAYLRLAGSEVQPNGRGHFFALAARTMRRILVDYATNRRAAKRGGGAHRVDLEEAMHVGAGNEDTVLGIDQALTALEA